jgi:hypothetical protein
VISFLAANWVTLLLGLLNIACWSQGWFGHPRRGAVMTIGAQVPWTIWDLTHHAAGFLLMTAVVVPVAVLSLWKSRDVTGSSRLCTTLCLPELRTAPVPYNHT